MLIINHLRNPRDFVNWKTFAVLLFSIFLISSCTSASSEGTQTIQPTVQQTASPTAVPVAYTDLNGLFEARLASGEWTREEGLISMLQLVSGENTGEGFLEGAQILNQSATGILLQARNYLEVGTDETAKEEIQRLLSAMVPSLDALLLYSAPADAKTGRSAGHSAQIDCRTLLRDGFPADRATQCFQLYEEIVDGFLVRIFFPEDWGTDEARRQYLEATREAVSDSIRAYSRLGLVHRTVYVFFTLLEYSSSGDESDLAYASAELALPSAPITNCMVAVYPSGVLAGTEEGMGFFKQTVAHEMFHCYQYWNYPEASMWVPYEENDWWLEGTADYFSNYVYPTVNGEHMYTPSFDDRSPIYSLIEMDYENVVLFQYLANEIGNAGVLRLIESMPTSAGASQADALSAFPDIEELFHNFGRAYFDRQIADTGGGMVPARPLFETITFNETTRNALGPGVDRFVLQRFRLIFPEEHHFAIEVGFEGAEGMNGVRLGGAGAWEPLDSAEFDQSCGSREMILLMTTSAAEGLYHIVLDVAVEAGPGCDECLIGLWELDNASYEAYWNTTPAGEAEGVTYNGVSGVMWGSFSLEGEAKHGWTDFKISYTQEISGIPDQNVAIILNGTGRAAYSVFGDTLNYSDSVSNFGVEVVMNGRIVGSTGISPEDVGGAFTTGPYRYVCTDLTLQFISVDYPQLNELIFLRAE